jgi:hypothetical protein
MAQQGGDDPVELSLVESKRRCRLKVQTWWHPKSWVGVVSLLSRPGPWAA